MEGYKSILFLLLMSLCNGPVVCDYAVIAVI